MSNDNSSRMEACKVCYACEKVGPQQEPCNVSMQRNKNVQPIWIKDLTVFPTNKCNFACKYCFIYNYPRDWEGWVNMKLETAKRMCQWSLGRSGPHTNPSIHWFGGEPLVAFDLIKDTVEYGDKLFEGTGKSIRWGVTTNLALVTEEVNDFLRDHKFYTLCSVDGTKKSHDKYRVLRDGGGTWDQSIAGLKRILEWNDNVTVRWTVMPDTSGELLKGTKMFLDMGAKHIAPEFVYEIEWKQKDLLTLEKELNKLIPLIIREAKKDNILLIKPFRDGMWSYVNSFRMPDRCGLGKGSVGVSTSGDLFLCHRFVDQKEHKAGDIWNGLDERKLKMLWKTWDVNKVRQQGKNPMDCINCAARMHCHGGCLAVNWDVCGNLFEMPKAACDIELLKLRVAGNLLKELNKNRIAGKYISQIKKAPQGRRL